jgi:hypothetical protein
VLLATWRGAAPERWLAGTFILMFALDRFYHVFFGPGHDIVGVSPGHILIDAVAAVLFVWIGLSANRVYPLWVAGFQLMAVVSHVVRAISPAIASGAYKTIMIAPSYLQTAAFTLGVILHMRREIRYGPYRSWRDSSLRSQMSARSERPKNF